MYFNIPNQILMNFIRLEIYEGALGSNGLFISQWKKQPYTEPTPPEILHNR